MKQSFVQQIVRFSLIIVSFLSFPVFVSAQNGGLSLSGSISFARPEPLVSEETRIYATILNRSGEDTRGIVKFFDGSSWQIGSDQPFTILQGKTADVFVDYTNLPYGERNISLTIIPWDGPEQRSLGEKILFVDRDSDGDTIPDRKDPDDDNDGFDDDQDAFPLDASEWLDTDQDGQGDNADPDDDNDTLPDEQEKEKGTDPTNPDTDGDSHTDFDDQFPLNPDEWQDSDNDGTGNNADPDDDNDGVPDEEDELPFDPTESKDFDGDGVGDGRDFDDDDDGLSDGEEGDRGTDPRNPDTDGDGFSDGDDVFPLDNGEWQDMDDDGLGDNQDPNNENKGPVVSFTPPESMTLLIPYSFDASQSYDPDGEIVSISWNIGGKEIEQDKFLHIFFTPGKHYLRLLVTDSSDESREQVYMLNVSGILYIVLLGIVIFILLARQILTSAKQKGTFSKSKVSKE